jgi:hypothetical protein
MYLSIDAITDVSKADSLIKAQEMGLLCMKYHLSKLYYKLFLTLLTDSGKSFRNSASCQRIYIKHKLCRYDLRGNRHERSRTMRFVTHYFAKTIRT